MDVIMIDFESQPWWGWDDFKEISSKGFISLKGTLADPRWPALREQLNAAGKPHGVTFGDDDMTAAMIMKKFTNQSDYHQWVWTDVMLSRRGAYLNRTLFESVRKHFPAVKGSDYDHSHRPAPGPHWAYQYGGVSKAPVCCGSHFGTHGSRPLYGWSQNLRFEIQWTAPAGTVPGTKERMSIKAENTPYNMFLHYIRQTRGELLVSPRGVGMMPWVQPKNSSWYGSLCTSKSPCIYANTSTLSVDWMWEELIFHTALSGISEFLWYRSSDEYPTEGIGTFSKVLHELDTVVGRSLDPADALSLEGVLNFTDSFVLSGAMSATG